MRIEVVYSPAERQVDRVELDLAEGSTAAEALLASGLRERHPGFEREPLRVGVWGRLCEPGAVLREGDRVELYRALKVDPKEARRRRHAAEGVRKRGPRPSP